MSLTGFVNAVSNYKGNLDSFLEFIKKTDKENSMFRPVLLVKDDNLVYLKDDSFMIASGKEIDNVIKNCLTAWGFSNLSLPCSDNLTLKEYYKHRMVVESFGPLNLDLSDCDEIFSLDIYLSDCFHIYGGMISMSGKEHSLIIRKGYSDLCSIELTRNYIQFTLNEAVVAVEKMISNDSLYKCSLCSVREVNNSD